MPQSVDPAATRLHQPPRVQVESIPAYLLGPFSTLQYGGQFDAAAGCHCDLELTVPVVEDDDPLITLEVRWFVDYDPTRPLSTRLVVPAQFLVGSFDSTLIQRPGPKLLVDRVALGLTDGFHVVDVIIAEQGGFNDASSTLPNRAMKPEFESAQYRFFINVVNSNPPSGCPNVLPSVRFCSVGP